MKENFQRELYKKAFWLSFFTVSYNILEGIFSILAGSKAKSISLVSFGLDSFAESLSGFIVLWRFFNSHKRSKIEDEEREKKAITLVGITFFIFGFYVLYEAIKKVIFREISKPSLMGTIILILSLIVMPVLYYQKNKTGKEIKSESLIGDSKETLACIFLSAIVFVGQITNYLWQLWFVDPFLAFFVCLFLFREGFEILKKKEVCEC